jgi:hypothetical protein
MALGAALLLFLAASVPWAREGGFPAGPPPVQWAREGGFPAGPPPVQWAREGGFPAGGVPMPPVKDYPKHPLAQEHPITIDATALTPPKVWSVPGATEPLQSLTGNMTNEVKTLKLRPGRYTFTTTSLSFEFTVDLEGKLDYSKSHESCLQGRGTRKLTVSCRFIMPQ